MHDNIKVNTNSFFKPFPFSLFKYNIILIIFKTRPRLEKRMKNTKKLFTFTENKIVEVELELEKKENDTENNSFVATNNETNAKMDLFKINTVKFLFERYKFPFIAIVLYFCVYLYSQWKVAIPLMVITAIHFYFLKPYLSRKKTFTFLKRMKIMGIFFILLAVLVIPYAEDFYMLTRLSQYVTFAFIYVFFYFQVIGVWHKYGNVYILGDEFTQFNNSTFYFWEDRETA